MKLNGKGAGVVRGTLEAMSGATLGLFLGVALYYFLVILLAEIMAASPAKLWLDFNPVIVTLLLMVAVATEFGAFKLMFQFGFKTFARIFAVSAMLVSALLFVATAVRQNPLLPFYGQ